MLRNWPRWTLIGCVMLMGVFLNGCAKRVDPVDQINAMVPQITDALNRRDAAALKKLATSRFDADMFIAEMFTQDVGDKVTLSVARIRIVGDEIRLTASAAYSPNETYGGAKELSILFAGDKKLKMDQYTVTHLVSAKKR